MVVAGRSVIQLSINADIETVPYVRAKTVLHLLTMKNNFQHAFSILQIEIKILSNAKTFRMPLFVRIAKQE